MRPPAVLLLCLALLVATGCAPLEGRGIDLRPRSSIDTLVEEIRTLPGITAVAEADPGSVEAEIDGTTGVRDLTATAEALFALVNDYRYPHGTPEVEVSSGRFTADVPASPPGSAQPASSAAPALGALPFLHSLPEVAAGRLPGGTRVEIELEADTDIGAWTEAAAARTRPLELAVHRPRTAAEPADPTPEQLPREPDLPNAVEYLVDLDDPASRAALEDIHAALDQTPYLLTRAEVGPSSGTTDLTVQVPGWEDILPAYDHLGSALGAGGLPDRGSAEVVAAVVTDSGLEVKSPDDGLTELLAVADPIAEHGGTMTSANARQGSIGIRVGDVDALTAVVDYASSDAWPLSSATRLQIGSAPQSDSSHLTVAEWPAELPLLVSLWDAGWDTSTVGRHTTEDGTASVLDIGVSALDRQAPPTAPEQTEIVRLLRAHDWHGDGAITIRAAGQTMHFASTADGRASSASLGPDGRRPTGWTADLIDAWNATAG